MLPKRLLDTDADADAVLFPAPKRIHLSVVPHTPLPPSSASCFSTPRTPHTPYPIRPSDSPSNPFGRKRRLTLTRSLPHPTSFAKHLALRFQYIRPGSTKKGGVYRIVQVPLSYTFTHLRCLIEFLFGCHPHETDEHLFEIKKEMAMYSFTYKPGQIRAGDIWAKLSTDQDPYSFKPESDLNSEDDKENEPGEEEETMWEWEPEDEFTLAHAWPSGGDPSRGIIYHHDPVTQIHISLNCDVDIPRRKGTSNTPFVFQAHGNVRLGRAPLRSSTPSSSDRRHSLRRLPSRTLSASSISSTSRSQESRSPAVRRDARTPDHARSTNHENIQSEDGEPDDPNAFPTVDGWNAPNAFNTYFQRVIGRVPFINDDDDDDGDNDGDGVFEDENAFFTSFNTQSAHVTQSTPALTFSSSPSLPSTYAPTIPSSSPLSSSSCYTSASAPPLRPLVPTHTYRFPKYTPAPPRAQRHCIDRVQKRLERMKRKGWMSVREESEEPPEFRVDKAKEGQGLFVKPVMKEGEVWDPFGDEDEI